MGEAEHLKHAIIEQSLNLDDGVSRDEENFHLERWRLPFFRCWRKRTTRAKRLEWKIGGSKQDDLHQDNEKLLSFKLIL